VGAKKTIDWLKPVNLQLPDHVIVLPLGAELPRQGLVATCYDDGQLAFLGLYLRGSSDHSWVLTLEQGTEKGTALLVQGSCGTADREYYKDGTWELFDAWSDGSKPKAEKYQVWVSRWIERIVDNARRIDERNMRGEELRKQIEAFGIRSVFKVIK
jgi:hypothetical protein